MKTQLLAAALVAAVGLASAAAAGPLDSRLGDPGDPGGHGPMKVLVIVSSRGLDLTSDAGADRFFGRLTAAVNVACDDRRAPPLTMARTAGFNTCRSQALETAMTYVHSPIVKRRYAAIEAKDNLRLARR